MTALADGLDYQAFTYKASKAHLLTVDLTQREIRPVMGAGAFPIQRTYPIYRAVQMGALASIGGGFNMTWFHHQGVADQPLHALVVDREIWTTGVGAGGYGLLLGTQQAWAKQNRIDIHVWRSDKTTVEVESVNLSHDGKVVAFTPRGGTNDVPGEGKHYAVLGNPGQWVDEGDAMHRTMDVLAVTLFTPPKLTHGQVVLEGRWPLKLVAGDVVRWTQRLGAAGVHTILSGWPAIIQNGKNVVPTLGLHGVASNGPDNWFIRKNPRAVLGASQDHRTAFVAVLEGRIASSVGLRLKEMATMLLQHGVYEAVNTDGGGSAFMWLKDQGLVAPGCYNTSRTLAGLRPDHYATAIF